VGDELAKIRGPVLFYPRQVDIFSLDLHLAAKYINNKMSQAHSHSDIDSLRLPI
jgi:hypothetical protein